MKKTCGELYLDALAEIPTENERRAFAKGFMSGQAEKVYLGACPAAMFRPSETTFAWLLEDVEEICDRYGLSHHVFNMGTVREIWICRHSFGIGNWYIYQKDSPEWHKMRAIACGIPSSEVDYKFHERKGYNQPCDQGALVNT